MDASSSIATGIAIDANGSPVGGVYPIVPVMRAGASREEFSAPFGPDLVLAGDRLAVSRTSG